MALAGSGPDSIESSRPLATAYRSAESYAGLISAQRQLWGSCFVGLAVIGVAMARSSDAPVLRAALTVATFSVVIARVRVFRARRRFEWEAGRDWEMPAPLSLLKDMVTPNSKWH